MDNLNQYFPFLVFLTPLILFYQQSKGIILKIFRIFWKERVIPYDFAFLFYRELANNSWVFNFDDYTLERVTYFSLKHNKHLPILFKMYNFEIHLYKYFVPIFIFGTKEENLKIQYLKFTFDFEEFIKRIIPKVYKEQIEYTEHKEKESRFYSSVVRGASLKARAMESFQAKTGEIPTSSTSNNSNSPKPPIIPAYKIVNSKLPHTIGVDINLISFDKPITEKSKYVFTKQGKNILNIVKKWSESENWYNDKNIRYYRGALLNGSAGTGKSSLVLEIAKKLGIPIWIFDLSTFDNPEFENKIDDLPTEKGIILFEDIDNIWDGRENKNKSAQYSTLTFDCFINKLSGVKGIKNKFVFITTNHMEKLDSALLRPGRIDEKIHLDSLNIEEKRKMASIILENKEELLEEILEKGKDMTTAEFENLVVQVSLEEFWNKNEK